jgi:hypothetical protein
MDSNVPNLDCVPQSELMEFWQTHQGGRKYRAVFPDGGTGTMRAVANLANYAANKATAISCRERGDIQTAQYYESICDRLYSALPSNAKW